jgi:hypothetical protein
MRFSFVSLYLQRKVQKLLKDGWVELPEDDKEVYRVWTEWDKKRYARDLAIYDRQQAEKEDKPMDDDDLKAVHIPKKRKTETSNEMSIPKKTKS